jgi:MbtH protein
MVGMRETVDDNQIYKVIVNSERQYSIWRVDRPGPLGWRDTGRTGSKAECLAAVREAWIDMRPLSLQESGEPAVPASDPDGKG